MKQIESHEITMTSKMKAVHVEDAIDMAGTGRYTYAIVLTAGFNMFASVFNIMLLSFVLPATDCDLMLTAHQKGILTSMMFTGMIFTTYFFGFISDEKGRRSVAMMCNLTCSFLNLLAAFAPDFLSLSIITFFNGVVTAGVMIPSYVYVSETVPLRIRRLLISIVGGIGNLPTASLPFLSLFLIPLDVQWDIFGYLTFSSWRMVMLIAVIPSFLSALMYSFLHESPKFLLSKGREEEALEVLRCMYAMNNRCSKNDFKVESICIEDDDEIEEVTDHKPGALKKLWLQTASLFHKPLLRLTVVSCIVQSGVIGASNAVLLWLPQTAMKIINYSIENPDSPASFCQILNAQSATSFNTTEFENETAVQYDMLEGTCDVQVPVDIYYVSLAAGLLQFVFFCLSGELSQWFGSKRPLVVFILVPASFAVIIHYVQNNWITIIMNATMAVALSAGIPITIGLTVAFFPTTVRSTANCLCMMCGRLMSSIGAQILGAMQENYCEASYYGFSVILIGISFIAMMLPQKKTEGHHET